MKWRQNSHLVSRSANQQQLSAQLFKCLMLTRSSHYPCLCGLSANVGTDRNLILMLLLTKISRKHGLAALLHEKPFRGVNGSGKHNNWSLGSNSVPSLLTPGPKPETNSDFMLFLAATIRAIDKHADLMRVAISGVGNDHRLGANEAPPAIVSVYLGDDIEKCVDRFIDETAEPTAFKSNIDLGVTTLPNLHRVPTDRNRTSTFAFTQCRFEFRAVGSSHNPSRSNQVLNTIVAESLKYMGQQIKQLVDAGKTVKAALHTVTADTLRKHRRVVFNGNGYSEEWQQEAARRGLPNFKSTPSALDTYYSEKNVKLFEELKVLDRTELQARATIMYEDYIVSSTYTRILERLTASKQAHHCCSPPVSCCCVSPSTTTEEAVYRGEGADPALPAVHRTRRRGLH